MVGGSPWPRRLLCLVGMLAVAQVSWFALSNPLPTWQTAAAGVSLIVALALAWLGTRRLDGGYLHWDGVQWQWSGFADSACTLQRHLDFQTLILVSLHRSSGSVVWLWLQRSHDPYQWLSLRRAVIHSTSPEQVHRANGAAPAHHTATP